MASLYDGIVNLLVSTGEVSVTTHYSRSALLIAMVKKIKCQRNRMRKGMGEPTIPKMDYRVLKLDDHKVTVVFKLDNLSHLTKVKDL